MGNSSIYLPPSEDTTTTIYLGPKSSVDVDIFDLDDWFMLAQKKANEQSTDWKAEFPTVFKNKTGKQINGGQAVLLWHAHRNNMDELKKSLLEGYSNLNEPVSPSKRKTKKKQR